MPQLKIDTTIDIDASPAAVWQVLTDFDRYPEWNPFITSASGTPAANAKLEIEIQPEGQKPMRFKPTVTVFQPNVELCWLGRVVLPGLFDGEHRFVVEPIREGQVRLHHGEAFSGLLLPMFRNMINTNTLNGFRAMNQALKTRVESGATL